MSNVSHNSDQRETGIVKMKLLFLYLVIGGALAIPMKEDLPSLEGAKVFRLVAETQDQLSAILAYDGQRGYDLLKYGNILGDGIHLMVTEEYVEAFEAFLEENEIESVVLTENVQEAVDQEETRQRAASEVRLPGRISFTAYQRYDTINAFLVEFAATHSNVASLIQIGTSYEGRAINGLKISSGGTGKPAILIEGGIHAREWISPSTVLYLINELVTVASNSDLYANVDWYFFPLLNPDGYEFSHTTYRLWRKTRSLNPGSSCRGTDPNRNSDYHWLLNGASTNPCSEVFAGPEPFSESETQALRDFVLTNNETIKMYLTYHSYGNYFLYPWGYTGVLPHDDEELKSLAEAADDAQATLRGTRYTIGTAYNVLYAAAGGTDDWVKAIGGVDLTYCVELPSGGLFGFDITASEIIPVGQESFLALRVFGEYVATKFATSK